MLKFYSHDFDYQKTRNYRKIWEKFKGEFWEQGAAGSNPATPTSHYQRSFCIAKWPFVFSGPSRACSSEGLKTQKAKAEGWPLIMGVASPTLRISVANPATPT